MALTRKLLEGMGIEERQAQAILDAHDETIAGLKAARDKYKELAEQVPELQQQLEEAEEKLDEADDWKSKYESEKKSFKDYQAKVDGERAAAAKAKAYRDMLKESSIDPKRIDAIMRVTDLSKVEMEDGKLKDVDKLAESAKKEWSDFVVKTKTDPSTPATPPKGIRTTEGADPEIVKRMQARHEAKFGKTQTEE